MLHSFLLIGQSNAAGRGFFEEADALDTCDGRLKVNRNGLWVKMFRPVNPDRSFSGTCFAESFAKEYACAHPQIQVGIIPCADGGTQISQWMPGEVLFENAVHCATLAMRTSVLKGILWHQGESDCTQENVALYEERLKIVMDTLRGALGRPDLPILIGGLGDYLSMCEKKPGIQENYTEVNKILQRYCKQAPRCAFVPATELGSNPDHLHFNAAALQEFGVRYYQAYQQFDQADESNTEPSSLANERTAIELL